MRLNATPQKYQRQLFLEEISAYELDHFLLDCEIFKSECFLQRNEFAEVEISKMKDKIQIDHINATRMESLVKQSEGKNIPSMFKNMNTRDLLPKGKDFLDLIFKKSKNLFKTCTKVKKKKSFRGQM